MSTSTMFDPIPVPILRGRITSPVTHQLGVRVRDTFDPLDFDAIESDVCARFGLTKEELHWRSRLEYVTWPRQVAMWCCVKLLGYSSTRTGNKFDRDHGTVLSAIDRVEFALEKEQHAPRTKKAMAVINALKERSAASEAFA